MPLQKNVSTNWLIQIAVGVMVIGVSILHDVAQAAPCDTKSGISFIRHDLGNSYCELCGYGYVTIVVANPYRYTDVPFGTDIPGAVMTDMTVVENLGSSGLRYEPSAPNAITYRVNNGPTQTGSAPIISGGGSTLTFTSAEIPALASLESLESSFQFNFITLTFAVRRTTDPEGLLVANRTIQATLNFETDSGCDDSPKRDTDTLPLRQPIPAVSKTGWNYDAGQRQSTRSSTVYGNNNDDIVWRIRIGNNGQADLQDLRLDDLMQSGSLVISDICPTESSANTIANNNGVGTASGCVSASNSINNFIVTNPFGDMNSSYYGDEIDVDSGGAAYIYLVGKITGNGSCITSKTNTVSDVQWGCQEQSPAGGIMRTSTGVEPTAAATFYSLYNDNHSPLTVQRRLTGTNTSQPVGSKGTMTITLRNNSGGSVKNIHLKDLLPPEYVMDPTFSPALTVTPAYGASYPGIVNTLIWTNENTSDPLANIAPEFDLTSNGSTHPIYPDQINMLRQGDVAVVRFRIVLIESDYYDRNANLDVNPEQHTVTGTDPSYQTPLSNTLTVDFDLFCSTQGHQTLVLTGNGTGNPAGSTINAFPEDLDIAVGGSVFILTNDPAQLLTLPIWLTNNGGHDAADYHAFVSFGATMEVVNAPSGCSPISMSGVPNQPGPWNIWVLPAPVPATATVYQCDSPAVISPGQTVTLNFDVRKTSDPARITIDDLSLRADLVGEITLSDGTPLWFPAPILRSDGELDRANNYSMDATWARVIGFNLKKSQVGTCNENNPPSFDSNGYEEVQLGEECFFHIETGGWFGFKTPGFAYIAVQNIDVVDEVPNGQVYISSTDPYSQSTSLIRNVTLNPVGLSALDEGWFDWLFNVPDSERIEVADEWFIVDAKTRLLNKPVDQRLSPNVHAGNSHNVLTSTFDATFKNDNTGLIEEYTLGPATVGYPNEAIRRVDLTLTEPNVTVVKEVCNETLYGAGTSCSNFVQLADDGDAYNSYVYRITLTNEANSDGVQRAPAYDVIVTDQLDGSDLAYVFPFGSDGLDNDGDGLIGGTDSNGEGAISDNTVKNSIPAELTFSYTHSTALRRIDPGQSVQLYYRVDYDNDAAPQQSFTNTVGASYDSLTGDFGNQSNPQRSNSDLGGARFYTSDPASASVRIIPVETRPKTIVNLSNTSLLTVPGTQGVSVGEEIQYQFNILLPVALLRNFTIRDELPTGIICSEAASVNLDAAPYSAAGFEPGGIITPTCTDSLVEWNFGNQRLTKGIVGNRYDFAVSFIALVENSAVTNSGDLISNGNPATIATAEYIDESGTLVSNPFGQVDVEVNEPLIELSKTFNVAEADGEDTLTVTVTATNNGTATAYNLRVLDDLDGTDLSYIGNVSGTAPPDNVDTATLGNNKPIFSWSVPNGIDVGARVSFTFDVRVATHVQPLQILRNSLQGDWTSLPGRTTALNSTATIAENGNIKGMRNGTLPNSGHTINDYETTADSQLTISAVALNKVDLEPITIPTIGAHKLFRVDIDLPEGISTGVSVNDSLNAAGLSYILANNSLFDISYGYEGIVSINGQVPGEAAFNGYPTDGTSGSAVWDIGTVVTETEDDTSKNDLDPVIHIYYYARVNNDLNTDAGDLLQNGVVVTYFNGETGGPETLNAASAAVTVSEPDLTLTKTLANVTPGKGPADPPFAGDILEYRLTAVNSGSSHSTAFDVNLADTLPAGLVLDTGFTPTATINSISVAGFNPLPAGAPVGPLVWGRENGDESLDIHAGEMLVVTYRTVVQIILDPAGLIENGVWSNWTSLDHVNSYERTGEGCPTITAPNDYCVGPVYATTTGVAPDVVFQKTVINETTGTDPGVSASPGDTLRYRLLATNISTAPASFTVTDDLDGLNTTPLFVPGSLVVVSSASGTDASDPNGGTAGSGLVAISDLTLDGGDSLIIEFTAQLAPVIINGTFVLNQAQLLLPGLKLVKSDDPNLSGTEDPTQTIISSSPSWLFEKSTQDLTDASTILFTGDVLRYTLTIKNTGTENATNVILRDLVPANTSYVAESTILNGNGVADPASGTSPLEGGMSLNAPEDLTAGVMRADSTTTPDNVATVTFDVQVDVDAASGTIISNQGFVNGMGIGSGAFLEQPSDDPATTTADDPTIMVVSSLEFLKSVFNDTTGGNGATAAPGDILRYRLEIINTSTGTLDNLAIVDELEILQLSGPTFFVPGTLTLISVPAGADVTGTDPTGGSKGAGILDIRDMSVASGETLSVEFTVQLAAVITSGAQVLNQADLIADGQVIRKSDDADPAASGAEDPTITLINSAPAFEVLKTSTILSGDPAVLLAGETLLYTITIKNIGNEDAVDVMFQDYTPANTAYVANSTTLNGIAVPDLVAGFNPLQSGIPVNATEDNTSGYMPADNAPGGTNTATLTFNVLVDEDAMDGLVITNQGFVTGNGAGGAAFPEQPSDDPTTPAADDPTRNVVGNMPLLYSQKTVEISTDSGSTGIVDPGDVLRYTIVISNSGAIPATAVTLTDSVPNNTTYVANSLLLNAVSPGPDAGVSPVIGGLQLNSSDNPGAGIISAGESAEISFEVQVNGGVATGTLISNQGMITSAELVPGLTDADGLSSNGYQPTIVVVGDVQLLTVTKAVSVVNGTAAEPGTELAYVIQVANIGSLPATRVVVTDDLSPPLGDLVTYIAGSGTMNGISTGVTFAGDVLTADYGASYGDLQAGSNIVIRFRVQINMTLAYGTTIANTGVVSWKDPQQTTSATVSIDVGGTPGSASLNGRVWHDANLDKMYDAGSESSQLGWLVELYLDNLLLATASTDVNGFYRFTGIVPSANISGLYSIQFQAPGAGTTTPSLGYTDSPFTDGLQRITDISVKEGSNLQNLNLPLWPNGIIYNSVAREPVAGARLTMLSASTGAELPSACFDDTVQQNQVTNQSGFYKFDLNFSDAACPTGGSYLIRITPPLSGYLNTPSVIIPPASDGATGPFSVPACPGSAADAVAATTDYCEAIGSADVPPLSVDAGSSGTTYYLHLTLGDGTVPGQSQIFNNPIPVDPELAGAVAITKTSSLTNVTKGALVPYTITVTNVFGFPLDNISIVDRFPAGFKYVSGSAQLDGKRAEPTINGRELVWNEIELNTNEVRIIKLLLVVGSGVSEGEYANHALVFNTTLNAAVSGEATATVRVIPDPDFDCTDVIGKVFDDRNLNGQQDEGETGLSGVRLVSARGLIATTDEYGRYHITCAVVPDEDRGSNFIIKLDDRSLPTGYRMVTENPRVQRATSGHMMRFNFGATIHRVVAIDIADGVFEPDSTSLRLQWQSKIDELLNVLKGAPAILRISYLADIESEGVVQRRLKTLKSEIAEQWGQEENAYRLTIETEVFWRRGSPLKR
ncbi:MAG: SdrD B-like domain-containing protein [Desulforhopalus sp.]